MKNFPRMTLSRRDLLAGASALTAAGFAGHIGLTPALAKAPLLNTQAPAFYRFKVGDIEATVISDGPLSLGAVRPDLFKGITAEELDKTFADNFLPTNNLLLDQNALVVNTGDRLVLFDTGMGAAKMFGPGTGRLLSNLKAAGIDPKDVDAIALTHAHPDHCWALMAEDGTRNFPNAQIYLTQADFDFWTDEAKASGDMMKPIIEGGRRQLLPNRDRMVFINDGQDIVPGVQAMATPGHTVGHMSFMIASQGKTLCNVGDVVHQHVLAMEKPDLQFAFDTDGAQAVASRRRLLDMLAAHRIPFLAYHFPWPGVGHVAKQGQAYRYVPAPIQTAL